MKKWSISSYGVEKIYSVDNIQISAGVSKKSGHSHAPEVRMYTGTAKLGDNLTTSIQI